MPIKMVREPSSTPNISSLDDFVGLRYAYNNRNGYCIGKGSEVGYSISGSIFRVLSGRVVIQGVECDIDANGVDIQIDTVATKRYHTVYAQVSLATMTSGVFETYDTAGFPEVNPGDDLSENTIGTARVPLYRFSSLNGVISDVTKVIHSIDYSVFGKFHDGGAGVTWGVLSDAYKHKTISHLYTDDSGGVVFADDGNQTSMQIDGFFYQNEGQYQLIDTSTFNPFKTEVERRLQELGFRIGVITLCGSSYALIMHQGNYNYVNLSTDLTLSTTQIAQYLAQGTKPVIELSDGYHPKTAFTFYMGVMHATESITGGVFEVTIGTDGKGYSKTQSLSAGFREGTLRFKLNLGYES